MMTTNNISSFKSLQFSELPNTSSHKTQAETATNQSNPLLPKLTKLQRQKIEKDRKEAKKYSPPRLQPIPYDPNIEIDPLNLEESSRVRVAASPPRDDKVKLQDYVPYFKGKDITSHQNFEVLFSAIFLDDMWESVVGVLKGYNIMFKSLYDYNKTSSVIHLNKVGDDTMLMSIHAYWASDISEDGLPTRCNKRIVWCPRSREKIPDIIMNFVPPIQLNNTMEYFVSKSELSVRPLNNAGYNFILNIFIGLEPEFNIHRRKLFVASVPLSTINLSSTIRMKNEEDDVIETAKTHRVLFEAQMCPFPSEEKDIYFPYYLNWYSTRIEAYAQMDYTSINNPSFWTSVMKLPSLVSKADILMTSMENLTKEINPEEIKTIASTAANKFVEQHSSKQLIEGLFENGSIIIFIASLFNCLYRRDKASLAILGASAVVVVYFHRDIIYNVCNLYTLATTNTSQVDGNESTVNLMVLGLMGLAYKGTSYKKIPSEILSHLDKLDRYKKSLSDLVQWSVDLIRCIITKMTGVDYMPDKLKFFKYKDAAVIEYLRLIDEINTELHDNKFVIDTVNYNRLQVLYKMGEEVILSSGRYKHELLTVMNNHQRKLDKLMTDFIESNYLLDGRRQVPVSAVFHGSPGTYKSQSLEYFAQALCAATLPRSSLDRFKAKPSSYIYMRHQEHEYWDGYTPFHHVTIIDDIGQIRDVVGSPDCEAMNWIRMVDEFEYQLHMADLRNKGTTPFRSVFCLASSNQQVLKSEAIFTMEAFQRRVDFSYKVLPKEGYRIIKDGDIKADPTKLPLDEAGLTKLDPREVLEFLPINEATGLPLPGAIPLDFDQVVKLFIGRFILRREQFEQKAEQLKATVNEYVEYGAHIYTTDDLNRKHGAAPAISFRPKKGQTINCPIPHESELVNNYVFNVHEPRKAKLFGDDEIDKFNSDFAESKFVAQGNFFSRHIVDYEPWMVSDSYNMKHLSYIFNTMIVTDLPFDEVVTKKDLEEITDSWYLYLDELIAITESAYFKQHYKRLKAWGKKKFKKEMLLKNPRLPEMWLRFHAKNEEHQLDYINVCFDSMNTTNDPSFIEARRYDFNEVKEWYKTFTFTRQNLKTSLWRALEWFFNDFLSSQFAFVSFMGIFTIVCGFIGLKLGDYFRDPNAEVIPYDEFLGINERLMENTEFVKGDPCYFIDKMKVPVETPNMTSPFQPQSLYNPIQHKPKTSFRQVRSHLKPTRHTDAQMDYGVDRAGCELVDKYLRRNMYVISIQLKDGFQKLGFVTAIAKQFILVPMHFLLLMACKVQEGNIDLNTVIKLSRRDYKAPVTKEFFFRVEDFIYEVSDCEELEHRDLAIVHLPRSKMHDHACIVDMFPTEEEINKYKDLDVRLVNINEGNFSSTNTFGKTRNQIVTTAGFTKASGKVEPIVYEISHGYVYRADTEYGDCGTWMTVKNAKLPKSKIYGIHTSGSPRTGEGFSSAISRELLCKALSNFDGGPCENHAHFKSDKEPAPEFISQGQFDMAYKVPKGISEAFKTHLVRSKLYEKWGPAITAPALLHAKIKDDEIIAPMSNALKKYCLPNVELDTKSLTRALDVYYWDIVARARFPSDWRLFTFEEAVLGLEDDLTFKSIARNTSPGYPRSLEKYDLPKRFYLFGKAEKYDLTTKWCIELKEDVFKMIQNARSGIRTEIIYSDHLKDERRPIEKVRAGKTRMFSASPIDYLIAVRMYFGSFVVWFFKNRIYNGSAIGVNPISGEWDSITRHLLEVGNNSDQCFGAGDYSAFDGSQKREILWMIYTLIARFYADAPKEDNLVRATLWEEIMHSRHINSNIVYDWTGSLPSGNPLTSIVNTIYNQISIRYCWERLVNVNRFISFGDFVRTISLGDDIVYCVAPEYRDIFNDTTLPSVMKEIGLTYTNETKDDTVHVLRSLCDIEFLKRSFRFEPLVGKYIAPLRFEVIKEMPYWTNTEDRNTIAVDNTLTAIRELTLHGKKVYDNWFPIMNKALCEEYGVSSPLFPFSAALEEVLSSE